MPLKVIGAGCERTGTYSQKLALEQLGLGPCHHMHELPRNPHLVPLWVRALNGEAGLWDEIFANYAATTDAPARLVYRELAEHYPDAKVILSVRDPERWADSMFATVLRPLIQPDPDGRPSPPQMLALFQGLAAYSARKAAAEGRAPPPFPPTREALIESFIAHNEEVTRTIPPERLLVYEVKDGWSPLCKFLDVAVPDTPFPRENSTADFDAVVAQNNPSLRM
jgi:Sulfotransferase domain